MKRLTLGITLLLTVFISTATITKTVASAQSNLPLNQIRLPAGFKIEVYANNIPDARSMTLGDNGTLFVGSRDAGKVYAVTGTPGATQVRVIASGLKQPNGVAFRNGSL